jgi:hypothetical protein
MLILNAYVKPETEFVLFVAVCPELGIATSLRANLFNRTSLDVGEQLARFVEFAGDEELNTPHIQQKLRNFISVVFQQIDQSKAGNYADSSSLTAGPCILERE